MRSYFRKANSILRLEVVHRIAVEATPFITALAIIFGTFCFDFDLRTGNFKPGILLVLDIIAFTVVGVCGGASRFGDCTPEQQRTLQPAVSLSCTTLRRCTGNDSCFSIGKKIIAGIGCINARRAINKICYGGGDPGHNIAIAQAEAALRKCENLFHKELSLALTEDE